MLPHPAAPNPSGIATACPDKSATGLMCAKGVDAHQRHGYGEQFQKSARRMLSSRRVDHGVDGAPNRMRLGNVGDAKGAKQILSVTGNVCGKKRKRGVPCDSKYYWQDFSLTEPVPCPAR